jgi:hypothetical protein
MSIFLIIFVAGVVCGVISTMLLTALVEVWGMWK